MKKFLDDDFLLEGNVAKRLYDHAKTLPIFDYHCHLSPKEIYENRKFATITEVWLGGDHYKWRALRALGVDESYITGNQDDYQKFLKWAESMPLLVGNPLYHWTHLELQRFFGIKTLLNATSAPEIYRICNEKLKTMGAREMILMSNVKCLFTTDDPLDDLKYHHLLASDKTFDVKVLPAFRPDKAINIELSWFSDYIKDLGVVAGQKIATLKDLETALISRIDHFHKHGCRASDHALDVIMYLPATFDEVAKIFQKGLNKQLLTDEEIRKYKGYMMHFFGVQYHQRQWVQEYHIGALRDLSSRMLKKLGPNTGYDAINDGLVAKDLSSLLDSLDQVDKLPKTIIFCLNPRDNEMIATIITCFQSQLPGKMQYGSAWWFNDQKDGMERQLEAHMQNGVLARFIGMLTDSRSFLSYTRHEYFRRILCNKLGHLVENGEYPDDLPTLLKIVGDICYNNAMSYFQITL